MRRHHLAVVVAAAALAVAAAFWATSIREPDSAALTGAPFLPGLEPLVNDVTTVAIAGAGETARVTLEKGDTRWTVSEASGYRADSGKIRKLLVGLASARIVEAKTANPDNYARLGVEDIDADEAASLLVTLTGAGQPIEVLVGKRPDRDGTYVRLAGEPQSYLIDQSVQVEAKAESWLDRRLLDIPSASIQRVTVRHPDGQVVTAAKTARGDADFLVEDVPEGRTLSSPGAANAMATVLKGLNFDGVESAGEFDLDDVEPVVTEYLTFDGVKITSRALETDGQYYARFQAAFDETQARTFAPGAVAFGAPQAGDAAAGDGPTDDAATDVGAADAGSEPPSAAGADDSTGETPAGPSADAEVAPPDFTGAMEQAQALQGKLDGWVFRIPSYKYQQLTRRMEALLTPPAE